MRRCRGVLQVLHTGSWEPRTQRRDRGIVKPQSGWRDRQKWLVDEWELRKREKEKVNVTLTLDIHSFVFLHGLKHQYIVLYSSALGEDEYTAFLHLIGPLLAARCGTCTGSLIPLLCWVTFPGSFSAEIIVYVYLF